MAKVVESKQEVVAKSWWGEYKIIPIAIGVALLWWVLWLVLKRYVLNMPMTAGSVAVVLSTVAATLVLVRSRVARPLIVTLGGAAVLWTLGGILNGLWWLESIGWAVGLFIVSYGLFYLIAHIRKLWLSVVTAVLVASILVILVAQ